MLYFENKELAFAGELLVLFEQITSPGLDPQGCYSLKAARPA